MTATLVFGSTGAPSDQRGGGRIVDDETARRIASALIAVFPELAAKPQQPGTTEQVAA